MDTSTIIGGIFVAAIIFLCGIVTIVSIAKDKALIRKTYGYVLGLVFLIWGGGTLLAFIVKSENMAIFFFIGGIGCLLVIIGIKNIMDIFRCNTVVPATYVRNYTYTTKGRTNHCPIFKYYFQGQNYEQQTGQVFSDKYMKKHFELGKSYEIYICSDNPQTCIPIKEIRIGDVLLVIGGIIFVLVGIFTCMIA